MGSVACSACGYVRWTPATPCPACGADPDEVLPEPASTLARVELGRRDRDSLSTPYWVVPDSNRRPWHPGFTLTSRRQLAEIISIVAVAILLLWVFNPNLRSSLGLGAPSANGPQIVIPAGTVMNVTGGQPQKTQLFSLSQPGTLVGSYTITGGAVHVFICYLCNQFDYRGPVEWVYDSGPMVGTGVLNVHLTTVGSYGVEGWPDVNDSQRAMTYVDWTSAAEVVY